MRHNEIIRSFSNDARLELLDSTYRPRKEILDDAYKFPEPLQVI